MILWLLCVGLHLTSVTFCLLETFEINPGENYFLLYNANVTGKLVKQHQESFYSNFQVITKNWKSYSAIKLKPYICTADRLLLL